MINNTKLERIQIIKGNQHTDDRGILSFINDFDMSAVKRMYTINHPSIAIVRAWQGHKIESKYIKCIRGRFLIAAVAIDDWNAPSINLIPKVFILNANNTEVLYIPKGYANGIKAIDKDSELLVFSDLNLETAKTDNYRFNSSLWMDWDNYDLNR